MASLGLEEERLYYISFDEFLQTHPELKNVQRDLQERRYNHYEEKRKRFIEEAQKQRKKIIENKRSNKKLAKSTSAAYILEQGSTMLKEERDKLKYLKNQQISELKNIIEYEFKLEEIKKKNEEKRRLQEKKEEQARIKREYEKRQKEEKQKILERQKEEKEKQ